MKTPSFEKQATEFMEIIRNYGFDHQFEQHVREIFIARLQLAWMEGVEADKWVDVEKELPDKDKKVWFWLIPKPDNECPHDSSGYPIKSTCDPYMQIHKWGCWPGLFKPTHWQSQPKPPEIKNEKR